MITNDQFMKICSLTRQYLKETAEKREQEWLKRFPRAGEHRWQHTLNVLHNAEIILAGENAAEDIKDIVRIAVILHDISMFVCDHQIHGRVSSEIAEKYLLEEGYPDEFVARVTRAIAEHGTDLGPLSPEEQGKLFSYEGKIVLEADILDKLGASTITDTLLSLGARDRLGFECREELSNGRAMERAAFFRDYIWTETGKKMAEQRFGFFLKFLDQLGQEVVESSMPL
ncbi:MAG TPA: HD domain-containing protein [Anaerolineales bacterium]|nr:HD domain-containing protein [Anaerolineales bacterium]